MDPISNSDRLIALLRQRLKERAGRTTPGKATRAGSPQAPTGLAALAALHGLDQAQLRRTCVQALLADQFGPDLINEPRFQQLVGRVTDALAADTRSADLLDQVVGALREERG
jgi:hypothetical protein